MKTKNRQVSLSVLIVLIVAILLIVSVTFAAIFRRTSSVTRNISLSNLAAESVVTFDGVTDMSTYSTGHGVRASVNPSAPNYIGKLRASVQYKGKGTGLIRVHMIEEWSTTSNGVRTVQSYQLNIPYLLSSTYSGNGNKKAWYDNRINDYCYYFTTPVYSTGTSKISLITGIDETGIDLGVMPLDTEINVIVEADVVQVNRYPQYWGLTQLPWTGGVSLTDTELSTVPTLEP